MRTKKTTSQKMKKNNIALYHVWESNVRMAWTYRGYEHRSSQYVELRRLYREIKHAYLFSAWQCRKQFGSPI